MIFRYFKKGSTPISAYMYAKVNRSTFFLASLSILAFIGHRLRNFLADGIDFNEKTKP
jgi:hypothetical protein